MLCPDEDDSEEEEEEELDSTKLITKLHLRLPQCDICTLRSLACTVKRRRKWLDDCIPDFQKKKEKGCRFVCLLHVLDLLAGIDSEVGAGLASDNDYSSISASRNLLLQLLLLGNPLALAQFIKQQGGVGWLVQRSVELET